MCTKLSNKEYIHFGAKGLAPRILTFVTKIFRNRVRKAIMNGVN
jgi:hypothetical protein